MRRQLLTSATVLVALALLVLMPIVEANYMVGYPFVGTAPKTHEARRWLYSGFYEGREIVPFARDRSVKRYYIGGSEGRVWQPSLFSSMERETSYEQFRPIISGMRCLGCELGKYDLLTPNVRRGRYYYANSRIAARQEFIFTGLQGSTESRLTTYSRSSRGAMMRGAMSGTRSRLLYSPEELAKLHEEASKTLGEYKLEGARRCLNCLYERGTRYGRYYSTNPKVEETYEYVPLSS